MEAFLAQDESQTVAEGQQKNKMEEFLAHNEAQTVAEGYQKV